MHKYKIPFVLLFHFLNQDSTLQARIGVRCPKHTHIVFLMDLHSTAIATVVLDAKQRAGLTMMGLPKWREFCVQGK